MTDDQAMIDHAIDELQIDSPIYSARVVGGRVELHLLGRDRPVHWPVETDAPAPAAVSVATDDLTTITGIGKTTADRLHNAGYNTIEHLKSATVNDLIAAGIGRGAAAGIYEAIQAHQTQ
jgi:predicted Fe-Mo cluster-binding NifX family protein